MNKSVVASAAIITGSGIINAWVNKKPVTRVIVGGYVFILTLSIGDMFGGELSKLMSALALLAATYVLITEFPWGILISTVQGTPSKPTPAPAPVYPPNQH
jgi:hypothetical protein